MAVMQETIRQIVHERGGNLSGFDPDVRALLGRVTRAEGMALTSYGPEEGPRREQSLLELVIREDGGLQLICGRGTDAFTRRVFPAPDRPSMTVIPLLVLGLTHSVAALAGRLAATYTGYQGQWQLGIRMDRLRGAAALDLLQDLRSWPGNPYSREEYEKITSASTEELLNEPHAVAERLFAPLLRGLGIGPRYLPYKPW